MILQVVGSLFVILAVGWAWSLPFFPKLWWLERSAVALGLGLVLLPLGAFVWVEVLGLPLRSVGAWTYVVLLTALGLGVWRLVLRVRPDHVRQEPQEQELHGEEEQDA